MRYLPRIVLDVYVLFSRFKEFGRHRVYLVLIWLHSFRAQKFVRCIACTKHIPPFCLTLTSHNMHTPQFSHLKIKNIVLKSQKFDPPKSLVKIMAI